MFFHPVHNVITCLKNTTPIGRKIAYNEPYFEALKNSYTVAKDELKTLFTIGQDSVNSKVPREEYLTDTEILLKMWGIKKPKQQNPNEANCWGFKQQNPNTSTYWNTDA